jgi:hypothetical protein
MRPASSSRPHSPLPPDAQHRSRGDSSATGHANRRKLGWGRRGIGEDHVLHRGLSFGAPLGAARIHPRADGDAPSVLSALSTGAAAAAGLGSPRLQLFVATELHLNLLCERRN